jgi:hypothetical protein
MLELDITLEIQGRFGWEAIGSFALAELNKVFYNTFQSGSKYAVVDNTLHYVTSLGSPVRRYITRRLLNDILSYPLNEHTTLRVKVRPMKVRIHGCQHYDVLPVMYATETYTEYIGMSEYIGISEEEEEEEESLDNDSEYDFI